MADPLDLMSRIYGLLNEALGPNDTTSALFGSRLAKQAVCYDCGGVELMDSREDIEVQSLRCIDASLVPAPAGNVASYSANQDCGLLCTYANMHGSCVMKTFFVVAALPARLCARSAQGGIGSAGVDGVGKQ